MSETQARELVRKRANGRCEVCGGRGYEYSHRRRRSIREHRWCPCNACWSCQSDHARMHASPAEARVNGWHVSIFMEPSEVPVLLGGRWWLLNCDGSATYVREVGFENGVPVCLVV